MQRIDIAPTKSNLRKVRTDLEFAKEGFELLNQKREILVIEIVKYVRRIRDIEKELKTVLDDIYRAYKIAACDSGSEVLAMKSLSEKKGYELKTETARLMGIVMPVFSVNEGTMALNSSLAGTGAHYDMLKKSSIRIMMLFATYATLTKSIFMLSSELKKVQRRVNALEKIFIPEFENTRKYISDRLEEIDREEIYIKKMISERGSSS